MHVRMVTATARPSVGLDGLPAASNGMTDAATCGSAFEQERRMMTAFSSLRAKVWLLIAISCTVCLGLLAAALLLDYRHMHDSRLESVRFMVESAHSLASGYHEKVEAGALTPAEAVGRFRDNLHAMRYDGSEYLFAFDLDHVGVAYPPDPALVGQNLRDIQDPDGIYIVRRFVEIARTAGAGELRYSWPRPDSTQPLPKLAYIQAFEPWDMLIGTGVYIDDINSLFFASAARLLAAFAVIAGSIFLLVAVAGNRLSRTIRSLSVRMLRIAEGEIDGDVPEAGRRDELGAMARALLVFKEQAVERHRLEADGRRQAEQAEADKRAALIGLAADFEHRVGTIVSGTAGAADQVRTVADRMAAAADETGGDKDRSHD